MMDDISRTYRRLKGVRHRMKRCLKELHFRSETASKPEMEELEEMTRDLAKRKTFLRKKFDSMTKRKGPYKRT